MTKKVKYIKVKSENDQEISIEGNGGNNLDYITLLVSGLASTLARIHAAAGDNDELKQRAEGLLPVIAESIKAEFNNLINNNNKDK